MQADFPWFDSFRLDIEYGVPQLHLLGGLLLYRCHRSIEAAPDRLSK